MNGKDSYNIEFTLKFNDALKSLVIVADPKNELEFVNLCDNVYNEHKNDKIELLIYFFRNTESARKFTYLRMVEDASEMAAVNQSQCIGRLRKNMLTIFKEVPRLIKSYSTAV